MNVVATPIPDVLILEPKVYSDARGFFFESFNSHVFMQSTGLGPNFVQDNHSCSSRGVLRGLHYQVQQPQGKLIRVIAGKVFDVAVDLRKQSTTFGQWAGEVLSAENKRMMWVPQGFAHGFLVLSDQAEVLYKTTDYYAPQHERCIRWDDPTLNIHWPIDAAPVLSSKDMQGVSLCDAEVFE
jgi:dTDP-4-dehydrorhamnose 3,5-epimerase